MALDFDFQRQNSGLSDLSEQEESEARVFVNSLLSEFYHTSVIGFHTLAYICEREYYEETRERLTEVDYEIIFDGCMSKAIHEILCESNDVEMYQIERGGEWVDIIDVINTNPSTLDHIAESIINDRIEDEATRKELYQELSRFHEHQRANLGEILEITITDRY